MRIGVDISQLAYENTGVANYLKSLIENLVREDTGDEFVLFYSSMRKNLRVSSFKFQSAPKNLTIKHFKLPPTFLDFLWNKMHIAPIEWFIGDVDIFITSDWTEPPAKKAKKATILYDLVVYTFPQESDEKIVATQKRKLRWVKKESEAILCISEATKQDAIRILGLPEEKLYIAYPGIDSS